MNLEEFIMDLEGSKNDVYLDSAGLPTIGVGHLLTKDELSSGKIEIKTFLDFRKGLSQHQVIDLFRYDLQKYEDAVDGGVKVPLNIHQRIALVSFCYNVGIKAFLNSTLLKELNRGNYPEVPNQLRRWVFAGGRKNRGLIERRRKEIVLWNF